MTAGSPNRDTRAPVGHPVAPRWHDWGMLVTAAACLVLLTYVVFYVSGAGTEHQGTVWTDVAYIPICLAAVVLGIRAARQRMLDRRSRRAWGLIALGFGCGFVGVIFWFWYQVIENTTPYPSVSNFLWMGLNWLIFVGMLVLPVSHRNHRDRVKLGLDVLIVSAGGFMIIWYLVLGPTLAAGSSSIGAVIASVGAPVSDLVVLAGIAAVLLRGVAPSSRRPLQILVVGLVLFVAADIQFGYAGLHANYVSGKWPDLCYLTANVLFGVSANDQYHRALPGRLNDQRNSFRTSNRLPYVAVALACGLLLVAAHGQGIYPLGGMIGGAVILTAVVVVRQMYALHENLTLATTDTLTGIANRGLVQSRLDTAIAQAGRTENRVGVLMLDLDRFKPINDSLGHEAGDSVLLAVAQNMLVVTRDGDTVGRLGGDEFAVLLKNLPAASAEAITTTIAERLLTAIAAPILYQGHVLSVSASIGIAISDSDIKSGEELLQRADLAMYAAKKGGSGRCAHYSPQMTTNTLGTELRLAVERDEFVVHYQPIIDLTNHLPVGVEALVRWQHPTRGLVGPFEFIPLAEETGLIVPLGTWVLREACQQMTRWENAQPATRDLALSVNMSPLQIRHPGLVSQVSGILNETGFDARRLTIEITEGTLLDDDSATVAKIEALRGLGVRFAVDDFGTGYSTLSYLRRLPVDILKIDKSFIDDILTEDGWTICDAVVHLGHALKLEVVAEGIEDNEHLLALHRMRCTRGQGYLFARPLTPAGLETYLQQRAPVEQTR